MNLEYSQYYFQYPNIQSINTQVLAFILEKATGKGLQELMQERLWKPLGTESDALDKAITSKLFVVSMPRP